MFLSDGFFSGIDELETPRLRLRKLTLRDAPDIFEYSKDPEVARHVLWEAQQSVSDARAYIRYMLRKYRAGEPCSYGIELKSEGKVIGTIGYMSYQREHNSAELGYSLSRDYWNQGIMTEALAEVIRYSFDVLRIHRLEAQHEIANPASGAVMKKCGMKKEGVMRGRLFNKGRFVDVALYAILRTDPQQNRGE